MNNTVSSWLQPPQGLKISDWEVHIWRIFIDLNSSIIKKLSILSADEQVKAARFRFDKDCTRFIIVRSILRTILSYYLGEKPQEIKFDYNQYGKPSIHTDVSEPVIRFNLSHSHEIALIAVAHNREIGVDVEYINTNFDYEKIAERFLSENEKAVWRLLPACSKREAFFNCWTRKEAYIKAKGKGLSLPLNEFDVSFKPGEPAALLNTAWDEKEVSYWSLQEIIAASAYASALAIEAGNWDLKLWQWSDNFP